MPDASAVRSTIHPRTRTRTRTRAHTHTHTRRVELIRSYATRVICHHLHKEVIQKFPESKYSVLSGFFFLRFICPAIVSPERYGLIDGSSL